MSISLDKCDIDAIRHADRDDPSRASGAWEMFGRWEARWREAHPDDERDAYELATEEYGRWCNEQGQRAIP
jgi:hypothetical protein